MFTTQAEPRVAEPEARGILSVEAAIARDVLWMLGRPGGFHRMQVKPVCRGKYRVNVYCRGMTPTVGASSFA
jgi:hypothetical protein